MQKIVSPPMQQKTGHAVIDLAIDASILVIALFSKFIIFSQTLIGACLIAMDLHDYTEFTDALRSTLGLITAALGLWLIVRRSKSFSKKAKDGKVEEEI